MRTANLSRQTMLRTDVLEGAVEAEEEEEVATAEGGRGLIMRRNAPKVNGKSPTANAAFTAPSGWLFVCLFVAFHSPPSFFFRIVFKCLAGNERI